jgi:hypothetical protein
VHVLMLGLWTATKSYEIRSRNIATIGSRDRDV